MNSSTSSPHTSGLPIPQDIGTSDLKDLTAEMERPDVQTEPVVQVEKEKERSHMRKHIPSTPNSYKNMMISTAHAAHATTYADADTNTNINAVYVANFKGFTAQALPEKENLSWNHKYSQGRPPQQTKPSNADIMTTPRCPSSDGCWHLIAANLIPVISNSNTVNLNNLSKTNSFEDSQRGISNHDLPIVVSVSPFMIGGSMTDAMPCRLFSDDDSFYNCPKEGG